MSLSAVTRVSDSPRIDPLRIARSLEQQVARVVRGKPEAIQLALCALLAGEHLLVEDVPGTGKTLLARSLARAVGGEFRRVQCTPDLLPSDITGTSVFDQATATWTFRAGPIFANVVLVDELNRASPRTQSALLEPMEEAAVTFDGSTHRLPAPHLVVATQNPFGSAGTFALPESQLDRFGVVLTMGLPDRTSQRELLRGNGGAGALDDIEPVTNPLAFVETIEAVAELYVADAVLEYVLDLVEATRRHAAIVLGASPRATDSIMRLARAHAVVCQRRHVSPDDVQAIFRPALAHRVVTVEGLSVSTASRALDDLVNAVAAPPA